MRAGGLLLVLDPLMQGLQLRPMGLRAVVMLRMVAVLEPQPVVEALVAADTQAIGSSGSPCRCS